MIFNAKKFYTDKTFTCCQCGYSTNYTIANNGCPICSQPLFRVADKGQPQLYVPFGDRRRPYIDEAKADPHSGKGVNKNRLGEEDFFGGGNSRGSGDPRNRGDKDPKDLPSDATMLDDLDNSQLKQDRLPATNYNLNLFDEQSPLGNPFINNDKKTPFGNMTALEGNSKSNFGKDFDDIFLRQRKTKIRGINR